MAILEGVIKKKANFSGIDAFWAYEWMANGDKTNNRIGLSFKLYLCFEESIGTSFFLSDLSGSYIGVYTTLDALSTSASEPARANPLLVAHNMKLNMVQASFWGGANAGDKLLVAQTSTYYFNVGDNYHSDLFSNDFVFATASLSKDGYSFTTQPNTTYSIEFEPEGPINYSQIPPTVLFKGTEALSGCSTLKCGDLMIGTTGTITIQKRSQFYTNTIEYILPGVPTEAGNRGIIASKTGADTVQWAVPKNLTEYCDFSGELKCILYWITYSVDGEVIGSDTMEIKLLQQTGTTQGSPHIKADIRLNNYGLCADTVLIPYFTDTYIYPTITDDEGNDINAHYTVYNTPQFASQLSYPLVKQVQFNPAYHNKFSITAVNDNTNVVETADFYYENTVPYVFPTIGCTVDNILGDGSIKLNFSGFCYSGDFANVPNDIYIEYAYAEKEEDINENSNWISIGTAVAPSNNRFAAEVSVLGLNTEKLYYFQARVVDEVTKITGEYRYSGKVKSVNNPLFYWNKDYFYFGVKDGVTPVMASGMIIGRGYDVCSIEMLPIDETNEYDATKFVRFYILNNDTCLVHFYFKGTTTGNAGEPFVFEIEGLPEPASKNNAVWQVSYRNINFMSGGGTCNGWVPVNSGDTFVGWQIDTTRENTLVTIRAVGNSASVAGVPSTETTVMYPPVGTVIEGSGMLVYTTANFERAGGVLYDGDY